MDHEGGTSSRCIFPYPNMFVSDKSCARVKTCKDKCRHGTCYIQDESYVPGCLCYFPFTGATCADNKVKGKKDNGKSEKEVLLSKPIQVQRTSFGFSTVRISEDSHAPAAAGVLGKFVTSPITISGIGDPTSISSASLDTWQGAHYGVQ
ncbi:hypothetical protein J6590_076401 [Homalodisca vitripennis]|nr:hypothetical protein J6590_076401 [Homalodisca vitripennis]